MVLDSDKTLLMSPSKQKPELKLIFFLAVGLAEWVSGDAYKVCRKKVEKEFKKIQGHICFWCGGVEAFF